MTTTTEKPRRRWFRLSLRTLMLLVLVVGGGLGWKANRAHTQRRAVAAIKAAGGFVRYDFENVQGGRPRPKEPSAPKWLRRMLGDEYFQEVVGVGFSDPVAGEALAPVASLGHLDSFFIGDSSKLGDGLKHLRGLRSLKLAQLTGPGITDARLADLALVPGLERVSLQRTAVTDEGLRLLAGARGLENLMIIPGPGVTDAGMIPLATLPRLRHLALTGCPRVTDLCFTHLRRNLPNLESLWLNQTGITDAGLAHLEEMPRLRNLQLQDTKVTDAGLAHLAALHELETLIVHNTGLTDSGLESVRTLGKLRVLGLSGTKVTDAGLARLEGLVDLNVLTLASTAVTDAGMHHLAGFSKLDALFLFRTGLTDAGLGQLAGLKALRRLEVYDTQVTAQGIDALRAALPALKVTGGPSSPSRPATNPK